MKLPALAFALLAVAGSSLAETVSPEISALLQEPRFAQAHWGILAVDLATDETLESHNAAKFFAPASVTKTFSVAAALDALGADFRFETPLYAKNAPTQDGVIEGDLVLVASGDPTMGGRTDAEGRIALANSDHTYAGFSESASLLDIDPLQGLNTLAKKLAATGVREVRGDLVVDDRLFEIGESSGSGPAKVTPLVLNDNLLDFLITPTQAGQAAKIEVRPPSRLLQVDAFLETVATPNEFTIHFQRTGPYQFHLRGRISQEHKPVLQIQEVQDAASFGRALFLEALERAGVRVSANVFAENRPKSLPADFREWKKLAALTSPPFAENAKLILKVSHNLHASTLPLFLAMRHGERTMLAGLKREGAFLRQAGIDPKAISFGGGAGGERADYVTPASAVQLLRYMAKHRDAVAYEQAMPVLGIDGTLSAAVDAASPARGKIRAKTGTLLWENHLAGDFLLTSKALAGYMTTAKDRRLAFAFFVNGVLLEKSNQTSEVGRALGRLCEIVHGKY